MCDALEWAAQSYAQTLAAGNLLEHIGQDGSTPSDRTLAQGYDGDWIGENIAPGQLSVGDVIDDWVASPGHYANIIREPYTHVGFGEVQLQGDRYHPYWVQEFGAGGAC
jgi:uncharacterized protein YkwD